MTTLEIKVKLFRGRRQSKWPRWYIARGRMRDTSTAKDRRMVSWRRSL